MAFRLIQRRYSKFMLDSKTGVIPRNTIHESLLSTTHLHTSSPKSPTISHPIFRNSPSQNRFYFKNREYNDQEQFHFNNTENNYQRWFHNPKRVGFTLFFFTCGALIGVSSGDRITVPFTGRSHFILFRKLLLKILPDQHISYEGELLPPFHPDSITARTILQNIMQQAFPIEMEIKRSLQEKTENDYEEKVNCEIYVCVEPEEIVTNCGRFGKYYATSAVLDRYRNQEEMIATLIGCEVGHDLARHNQELISKFISVVSSIGMTLYLFCNSSYIRTKMVFLDKFMRRRFLPSFSFVVAVVLLSYLPMAKQHRKLEYESDHIALMLAASAGYNPEVGVHYPVYLGELEQSVVGEFFSIFPSGRNRVLYLAQPRVINEAIHRYRHTTKPSGSADFI